MINRTHTFILIATVLALFSSCYAQVPMNPAATEKADSETLKTFNKERLSIQAKGMATLTAWSVGNIVYSSIGYANSDGGANAQFHKMNIMWCGINVLLAGPGLIGALKGKTDAGLKKTLQIQNSVEKTFLFNAGLDIAYVVGGCYLLEKAKTETNQSKVDMFTGYGNAVIFQGAFLMLFDGVMFAVQNNHGKKKLYKLLDNVSLSYNAVGYRHTF